MGPITRSQAASSDNGDSLAASATTPVNLPEIVTAPLARVLTDIADDATIHGRDARQLRDATPEAIYQSTSHLAQHVNRGNAALAEGFNESFTVAASSDNGDSLAASATTPVNLPEIVTAPLARVLTDIADDATIHGRDARQLRDATSEAVYQSTSHLAPYVNRGNAALVEGFNESFTVVAACGPENPPPNLQPFSGSEGNQKQFSVWLRRVEDAFRLGRYPATPEHKANFLINYLDGFAREKVEELTQEERRDFNTVVAHLRKFFESPQQRYVARQALSACRQEPGEPSLTFANRLLNLVRAATAGQDEAMQKERMLEEFVARLPRRDVYSCKICLSPPRVAYLLLLLFRILCSPPETVEWERMFSACGRFLNEKEREERN
ncbi:unnamed protein product [Heligmosomoides polygyrus]|uniref:Retrotrans_gag domain-containing protein n=1 Tax=Heligmosomoides polygyrus TaxID=6339 RepID=A0A183G4U0_HELPZ|nr:unnamed protein product [Heligmosomoides polygyrus]